MAKKPKTEKSEIRDAISAEFRRRREASCAVCQSLDREKIDRYIRAYLEERRSMGHTSARLSWKWLWDEVIAKNCRVQGKYRVVKNHARDCLKLDV